MSVWPQELSLRPAVAPQTDAARAQQGALLQPPLWRTMLLLAAIVVIGIVTGLLAAILLSSSAVQAAEPAAGSVLSGRSASVTKIYKISLNCHVVVALPAYMRSSACSAF